jgi:ribosomal protein L29
VTTSSDVKIDDLNDLTLYQIQKLVVNLKHDLIAAKQDHQKALDDLDELHQASEARKARQVLREAETKVVAWKNVSADLVGQLLIAQNRLMQHQIGISPDVDNVLANYHGLLNLP